MTELEKKAEEYAKKPSKLLLESLCCGSDLPENDYTLEEVAEPIKQAYIDGYEQGQKDNCETHKDCQFLKYFEKENEELKNRLKKMKNCQNCKHWDCTGLDNPSCSKCFEGLDQWELNI